MFLLQPAQVRDTEAFTRLPDRFRRSGVRSSWADANRGGQPTDSFLEGPVFDAAGNLYVTDIPFGRIFRIDPRGEWEQVAEWDGEPNGAKFLNERELIVTDYRNGLMAVDVTSGAVRPFLERRNSERFKGVNDLAFDSAGNLYFTDQGQTGLHDPTGRLYRLRPSGQLELLLANVPSPNGVALSPDERVLYLGVTRGNQVWRVPLLEDGSVSKVSAFFTSYGPSGPDGLAVDEAGRVIVANPGLGVAWVLNHRAEPEIVLRSCAGMSLTNLAFGGPDRKTLYCTESVTGTVLRATLDRAGLPLHRPRR
ncbi:MAG: SMP-30/gluconolactonase/LRE family protein [Proteobacteria bacterium]|uniref:SMP-30/gluconolactonase/LRE family protein n=1 Tax=Piscinibacter sp. TaxID=1903157 RepID=UPI0011DC4101|nr:SMP-30/gluconolactonase/LRE family protein [Piscinibacter sp.]MBP5989860.1 SMP-30/gluconolactonase/LRE family protein [Piscinibacter sp.]MBP6026985.1 SMP-30/gluconolactonase/LRE family protein [Piscinibacter sp.]MBS0440656.1 SMP-30/gluconolactonase/LRE family protein [Pseudomonadota bacterium]TXH62768.1 MAG: SMP-30/gluconolactonase/LRE family protein [Burkholderiaceae bacterium]